ncbi:TPA: hypothetical protein NPP85_005550 [Klebsiella variicola subsp. variicola]|nr:hypothetical protein [Klebsiella variicola subsp. variicola]HCT7766467.1 hypothetical protein [Klebsiella pneumoniae]HDS7134906.1 hypothetical protein [Klebsiella aerogenes]
MKVARSQRNKLLTMSARLTEMTCEWDGLSGWLETESERLVESINQHIQALDEQIRDWANGRSDREVE